MEADRASAIAVFGAFVLGVCGGNCQLQYSEVPLRLRVQGIEGLAFRLTDGAMGTEELIANDWRASFPSSLRSRAAFLREDTFRIVDLIIFTSRFGKLSEFGVAIVGGLSALMEEAICAKPDTVAATLVSSSVQNLGHRRGPAVKVEMRQLLMKHNIGKNYIHVGKMAKTWVSSVMARHTTHTATSSAIGWPAGGCSRTRSTSQWLPMAAASEAGNGWRRASSVCAPAWHVGRLRRTSCGSALELCLGGFLEPLVAPS